MRAIAESPREELHGWHLAVLLGFALGCFAVGAVVDGRGGEGTARPIQLIGIPSFGGALVWTWDWVRSNGKRGE